VDECRDGVVNETGSTSENNALLLFVCKGNPIPQTSKRIRTPGEGNPE